MIKGDLIHWDKEKAAFAPVFQRVVTYLRGIDLENIAPGKYEVDGDRLFVLIQELETVIPSQRKSEHHERYIDFQYLIRGEELFLVARSAQENVVVENKLAEHDYALLDTVAIESELTLQSGMFVVFFPDDLHRPVCSRNGGTTVKKAVAKIDIALLNAN